MQNTSLFSALSCFQSPWVLVFSFTTFLQEYQHWSNIQNTVWLANTRWSQPRKLSWSIKYSLISSLVVRGKVANKTFCLLVAWCFPLQLVLCRYTSLHSQWFYWQHLPFIFSGGIIHLFAHRMISSNKRRWSGICFLATLNSCRNLTLQYTQRVEVFLTYF